MSRAGESQAVDAESLATIKAIAADVTDLRQYILMKPQSPEISSRISKIESQIDKIEAKIDFRAELQVFREKSETLREQVQNDTRTYKTIAIVLAIVVPVASAIFAWLGFDHISGIESAITSRADNRSAYVFNLASGLALVPTAPADAARLLESSFGDSLAERSRDETVVTELLHAFDDAGMYQEGVAFINRLQTNARERYSKLNGFYVYNNMGVVLLGKAINDGSEIDRAIEMFNTAMPKAATDKDRWFANYNLWIAHLVKEDISKADSEIAKAQRQLASTAMRNLYNLPNATPGWKNWTAFRESFWFPLLREQRPQLEREAQQMWAPPTVSP